jgi:hypothetical protein
MRSRVLLALSFLASSAVAQTFFPPPPVQGLGTTGGFKLIIEDRGDLGGQGGGGEAEGRDGSDSDRVWLDRGRHCGRNHYGDKGPWIETERDIHHGADRAQVRSNFTVGALEAASSVGGLVVLRH